jgi:hypothetical protein
VEQLTSKPKDNPDPTDERPMIWEDNCADWCIKDWFRNLLYLNEPNRLIKWKELYKKSLITIIKWIVLINKNLIYKWILFYKLRSEVL